MRFRKKITGSEPRPLHQCLIWKRIDVENGFYFELESDSESDSEGN